MRASNFECVKNVLILTTDYCMHGDFEMSKFKDKKYMVTLLQTMDMVIICGNKKTIVFLEKN